MFLKFYRNLLLKFPLRTEAVQTGMLMGTGDLIAQKYVEKRRLRDIDLHRTKRFFLIGAFFVGPPLRLWYGVLHKFIGSRHKSSSIKKVVVDQIVFAPIFMAIMLSVINFAQTHSVEETKQKLIKDYPDVIKNNYLLWPAVQLINFRLVPLNYQVMTVQIVALFWNAYISWKTNKSDDSGK